MHRDFPEGTTQLEKGSWSNYLDSKDTNVFLSYDENRRLWQEIELERQQDFTPVHEIHPTELPDYHYWPAIQNDLHNKPDPKVMSDIKEQYHRDQTDFPRFHKNGVPKTPPQEQIWYVPLKEDGTFDWKRNCAQNGIPVMFSEKGWDMRYLRRAWKPMAGGRAGAKASMVHHPAFFRHRELNSDIRFFRGLKGNFLMTPVVFMFSPWLFSYLHLAWAGTRAEDTFIAGAGATYRNLHSDCHMWNPDIWWMKFYRDSGAFHSAI